jgi:hypothetical protein
MTRKNNDAGPKRNFSPLLKEIEKPASFDDHCIITAIIDNELIWGTALSSSSCTVPKGKVLLSLRSASRQKLNEFSNRIANADWTLEFENISQQCKPEKIPENLTISPTVSINPGYDYAVKWARETFNKLCPDSEWMPAMPDPADIIID